MGFGVPLDHWFRDELRDFARDVLFDRRTLERGYFRPEAVAQLLEEHQQGRFDHGYRLWSLLILELWQREWLPAITLRSCKVMVCLSCFCRFANFEIPAESHFNTAR